MANWGPLRERLAAVDSLTVSWSELDALVGGLPDSAYKYAAFWGGDRSAWSGFRTRDVRVGQAVTFVRHTNRAPHTRAPSLPITAAQQRGIDRPPRSARADLILVSCVKQKVNRPAAAKDLYISSLFAKARTYAEASGRPWYILSAKHALVEPHEVLEPYDVRMSVTETEYRLAWGMKVKRRLTELCGDLKGKTVEIHAGEAYVAPIRDLLRSAGATVTEPLAGLRHGPRLAWYNDSRTVGTTAGSPTSNDVARYVDLLRDRSTARTPDQFLATQGEGLRSPGLYSWWVDSIGADDLTQGLRHLVRPDMIYAGLAGATRELSGRRSSNTLWLRISGMHLGGRHEFSTLRLTIGSALGAARGWVEIDEVALTGWMYAHLRVAAVPVPDADQLGAIETAVLAQLDPPLNLSKVETTELRRRLTRLRRQYSVKRLGDRNRL